MLRSREASAASSWRARILRQANVLTMWLGFYHLRRGELDEAESRFKARLEMTAQDRSTRSGSAHAARAGRCDAGARRSRRRTQRLRGRVRWRWSAALSTGAALRNSASVGWTSRMAIWIRPSSGSKRWRRLPCSASRLPARPKRAQDSRTSRRGAATWRLRTLRRAASSSSPKRSGKRRSAWNRAPWALVRSRRRTNARSTSACGARSVAMQDAVRPCADAQRAGARAWACSTGSPKHTSIRARVCRRSWRRSISACANGGARVWPSCRWRCAAPGCAGDDGACR